MAGCGLLSGVREVLRSGIGSDTIAGRRSSKRADQLKPEVACSSYRGRLDNAQPDNDQPPYYKLEPVSNHVSGGMGCHLR